MEHRSDSNCGERLIAVGSCSSALEASMAKSLLESFGIESFLGDEQMGPRIGIGVQVLVRPEDAEAATEILKAGVPDNFFDLKDGDKTE